MKQNTIIDTIRSSVLSLSNNDSLIIGGFHPDLFLPLISDLGRSLFIKISDDMYDLVFKYLSSFWDDLSVAFVGHDVGGRAAPFGFYSSNYCLSEQAKELFSNGVGGVRVVVCSDSGFSVPIVGSGSRRLLLFDDSTSFDVCLEFLNHEKFCLVDRVASSGEYSTRGGIIDVFPRSSIRPYRINFLDSIPSVFSFDVDTQLTVSSVNNFHLSSVSGGKLRSLKETSLDGF